MVCSEKELGISDEHEGIILLQDDAPVGTPLADYMGDVVFNVKINPNMARNANVLGLAREVAALTGQPLRQPDYSVQDATGAVDQRTTDRSRSQSRNQPALHGGADQGREHRAQPVWGAAPAAAGRAAPDQQHRGRHQLRDAGDRPAAARLRL